MNLESSRKYFFSPPTSASAFSLITSLENSAKIFPLGFGVTAGDNQDWPLRVTDDVFGDAADKRVLQSGAAVSGSDDEINIWRRLLRCRFRRLRGQGEVRFQRSNRAKNPSA